MKGMKALTILMRMAVVVKEVALKGRVDLVQILMINPLMKASKILRGGAIDSRKHSLLQQKGQCTSLNEPSQSLHNHPKKRKTKR
jgi:hypothetical protein